MKFVFYINVAHFSSYLPIIVECCWTAASKSLSRMVHSPISVHPETRAHSTLREFLRNVIISCFTLQRFRFYLANALITSCNCPLLLRISAEGSLDDPTLLLVFESEVLISISPPIFDLQIRLMGRAVSGWREVGFNVLPELIPL